MLSDNTRLTDAALWRMALRVDTNGLTALLYNTADNAERDVRSFRLDPAGGRRLDLLTATIYDNPLLLSDFGRVSVVVTTPYMALIPSAAADVAVRILGADADDDAVIVNDLRVEGTKLAMKLPREEVSFIRRTFPDADIRHRLAVLIDYFGARFTAGGNGRRLYAIVNADSVDIVVMDRRSLVHAVSHDISSPMDAAYFIMALFQQSGMDAMNDEMFVGGSTSGRNEVMETLRTYVNHVMPVIIPGSVSHPAVSDLHFDLQILPLCE